MVEHARCRHVLQNVCPHSVVRGRKTWRSTPGSPFPPRGGAFNEVRVAASRAAATPQPLRTWWNDTIGIRSLTQLPARPKLMSCNQLPAPDSMREVVVWLGESPAFLLVCSLGRGQRFRFRARRCAASKPALMCPITLLRVTSTEQSPKSMLLVAFGERALKSLEPVPRPRVRYVYPPVALG